MGRKVSVWLLVLSIFISINAAVLFGAGVRYVLMGGGKLGDFGEILLTIADFPLKTAQALIALSKTAPSLIENRFPEIDGFKKNNTLQANVSEDKGYLLLSAFSKEENQSTVKLIRIRDQKVLHQWTPNFKELAKTQKSTTQGDKDQITHPFLLNDGGLIFQNGPLFKIDACSKVEWQIGEFFHHSIEKDPDGNFWIPGVIEPSSYDARIFIKYKDDALVKVSPDGKILLKRSVSKILEDNGYRGLLFGTGAYDVDPIHLNDIQPAYYSTPYWKKGDLLLSIRNRSTVFIYRPSTNKIIWLKTGPWLAQHDPDFIGQSKISVFGNNVIDYPSKSLSQFRYEYSELVDGYNNVYFYDFTDNNISTPYDDILKKLDVRTPTEGRSELLENGDLFIEETDYGRLLRLSPEKSVWEFVVKVNEETVGRSSWSRYLNEKQLKDILPVLAKSHCP
jgi:hypothetical protein